MFKNEVKSAVYRQAFGSVYRQAFGSIYRQAFGSVYRQAFGNVYTGIYGVWQTLQRKKKQTSGLSGQ